MSAWWNEKFLEKAVPITCGIISLLVLSPFAVEPLPLSTVLVIHIVSYLGLLVCFELPELVSNFLCLHWVRSRSRFVERLPRVIKILKVRYVLTHFLGPCTGIFAVTSGIYLIHRAQYSFQEGWLFWILIAASVGLYKGMYQHNTYLKRLWRLSENLNLENIEKLRQGILSPFDQTLIFFEFPTYVFIYWTASVKPSWFNPLASIIGRWEQSLSVWGAGVLILILGSVILLPLRWAMRRFGFGKMDLSGS